LFDCECTGIEFDCFPRFIVFSVPIKSNPSVDVDVFSFFEEEAVVEEAVVEVEGVVVDTFILDITLSFALFIAVAREEDTEGVSVVVVAVVVGVVEDVVVVVGFCAFSMPSIKP
jgi:hypothetical protein